MKQCNSFAFNVENYLVLGTNNKDPFKQLKLIFRYESLRLVKKLFEWVFEVKMKQYKRLLTKKKML